MCTHCQIVKLLSFALLCLNNVTAVDYNKTSEGYHMGLLSDCPGSWKPVTIRPRSLERLLISVIGPGEIIFAGFTSYNYYHIQNLVKNPMIDFKNKKTFLYVGGYGESTIVGVGKYLGHLYKEMGYNAAARVIRGVGKHAGEMLAKLTKLGLNPKNLTVVGMSLGGETMSFMAKSYREITGQNISFLVGMDTAGPCYRHLGPKDRLDPTDADFVLAITTNMDGFGIGIPVGTATFYVNGGEYQPGDISWLPCDIMCSHMWSLFLWVSALYHPGTFVGVKCDSVDQARNGKCFNRPMVTNTMDMYVDRSKPGIYSLPTTNNYTGSY